MNDQPKKPYVKPEVTQVDLVPEEAVLGNCKTANSSGPGRPLCSTIMCMTQGS
jgi:hypothetical protein